MLTVEQIEKWCAALRSGEYKQTTLRLQDEAGHCCLGVACEIFLDKKLRKDNGYLVGLGPLDQDFAELHNTTAKYFDIMINDGWMGKGKKLFELNDNLKLNFDEIADVLEAVFIHKVLD